MNGTIQKSPGPRRPTYLPRRSTTARSHCCAIRGDCMRTRPTTIPMMMPCGLFWAALTAKPAPIDSSRTNARDDVESRVHLRALLLRACGASFRFLGHVRSSPWWCETSRAPGGTPRSRGARCRSPTRQPADGRRVAATAARVRGARSRPWVGGHRRWREHERPDAALRGEHARPFQLGVHLGDGVGVHLEVHGELAHGRQAIAHGEPALRDRRTDAAIELRIDGSRIVRVDRKHSNHIVLVQWYNVKRVDRWAGGPVDGWTGGRVDGWTGGRVDGWTGGRVESRCRATQRAVPPAETALYAQPSDVCVPTLSLCPLALTGQPVHRSTGSPLFHHDILQRRLDPRIFRPRQLRDRAPPDGDVLFALHDREQLVDRRALAVPDVDRRSASPSCSDPSSCRRA